MSDERAPVPRGRTRPTTDPRPTRWRALLALLLALALVAAACGGDDGDDEADGGGDAVEAGSDEAADDADGDADTTDDGDAEDEADADGGDAAPAGDLPAFQEGAAQPGGTYGGTLRVAHWFPPLSLDPVTGSSGADHQVLYSMYDRLVHFDFDTLEFTPGLAESWEFTDDTTLVMNLRDGVTFHDGTPFDAEAVAYNVDRVQNHPNSKVPAELASVDSVDVIDDLTVQFNLNKPDSGLVGILSDRSGMIVSPTAAEAADEEQLDANPVGTGPFKLVEYAEGERLLLERNEDYWQEGLPYADQLEWLFTGDEQSGLNGLRAGDIDVALTVRDGSQVAGLEADPNIIVIQSPSLNTDGCYVNDEIPPWDDARVRKAFSMAVDRETVADVLTFGLAEPAYLPVPPQHWSSDPSFDGTNGYDPEGARALLDEAGIDSVDMTIMIYQNPLQIRKAELLQEAVAPSGFNVEVEVLELSAAVPAMFTDRAYEFFCAPWTGRPDPSQTVSSLFESAAYYSVRDDDRAGVDALVANGVASADIDDRKAAYSELWQVAVADEVLWIPLWHNASITATRSNVGGYQLNLLGKGQVQFAWLEN
jgi:peptide/nickel transport system permease protein/peptide/nickel transport system substrate-binding protein